MTDTNEVIPISRVVVADQDKIYLSATIKLGLKNYSTAEVTFGISQTLKNGADASKTADEIFDSIVMEKLKQFASKVASVAYKMTDVIESRNVQRDSKGRYEK